MSFPSTTTDLAAFQGWWWGNSTSTATEILCPTPQTVYSSGTWLDCVSSGVSVVPTTCASGILEYSDDTDTTCVSPASCFTMTVAQTDPIVSPSKRYMCARDDWIYDTIYRNYYIPSSVLATMTSTVATKSTTFSTITSATTTATATSSSDSSANSTSNPSSSSLPGGSIAGIVVGCLAGGAIIMALFFYRKRLLGFFSKRDQDYDPAPQNSPRVGADQVHEIGTSGVFAHEMESKNGNEMQTKQVQEVHEMGSGDIREVEHTEVRD